MEITTSKKNKEFSYIAFFDLDRTITRAISGRVIANRAFKMGHMKRSDLAAAIYLGLAYRFGLVDPVVAMEKMLGWVKGLPEHVLSELCKAVAKDVMLPSIYSEVNDELKIHLAKNAATVILSASLEPLCAEVANHLNMNDVICSRLEVIDGFLTGRPEGNLCYGDEKLVRLKEYCEKNNNKLEDSWYYGDSFADIPALEIVGNPVCINPDKKLLKAAEKNKWRVFFWQ
jgi:HAD superfamily hydrolase (TIGR01490 family)